MTKKCCKKEKCCKIKTCIKQNKCQCEPVCPCPPFPPVPPVTLTNIAVTATGPTPAGATTSLITFTVTNTSTVAAQSVNFTLPIPTGYSAGSAVVTAGTLISINPTTVWFIGTLEPGASVTLSFIADAALATGTGVFTGTATTITPESSTADNSATVTIIIPG